MANEIKFKGGGRITDVDVKSRTIAGYFSIFGVKDSDDDIILPGAFAKSIEERGPSGKNRIFHLWMHQTSSILAKPKELVEDKEGLAFVSIFPEEAKQTTLQRDVLRLYDQGLLNEHSIGFQIEKYEEDRATNTRILKELKLWEGSTVTWGANEFTRTTSVKSLSKPELLDRIGKLTKALRDDYYTDETFHALEFELAMIKEFVDTLNQKEPDEPLQKKEPIGDYFLSIFKSQIKF